MSLKRALLQPAERNRNTKIEARFQWVTELLKNDIDYMTNCVFIDELSFNINMKRSMGWATSGRDSNSENSQNESSISYYHRGNITLGCN